MSASPSSHVGGDEHPACQFASWKLTPQKRKARALNPHDCFVALFSKQARQTVSGYLPNCRRSLRERFVINISIAERSTTARGSFENRTRSSFLPRTRAAGTLTNPKVVGALRCAVTNRGRQNGVCLLPSADRQGIEPCLTASKTVVRIHHTRKPSPFSIHARN